MPVVTRANSVDAAGTTGTATPAWPLRLPINLGRFCVALLRPPKAHMVRPPRLLPLARSPASLLLLAEIVASMFFLDTAASAWARQLPRGLVGVFQIVTKSGLSAWFLYPLGFLLILIAAVTSAALPRFAQGVLAALAARFGFLFVAIGAPGLFVTIVKRLIGRARPFVGGHDNPFLYKPFIWLPEYASLPSGHSTTAVAVAIAVGALWPRLRPIGWLYALAVMTSRVLVLAHHPSDVLAGALVGGVGALMIRHAFAVRHLAFGPADLAPYPWPSWRRLIRTLKSIAARHCADRRPSSSPAR